MSVARLTLDREANYRMECEECESVETLRTESLRIAGRIVDDHNYAHGHLVWECK